MSKPSIFHFCRFYPWTDPINTYNTGRKQQWRTCSICNKAQKRTLLWDHQSDAPVICAALGKVRAAMQGSK